MNANLRFLSVITMIAVVLLVVGVRLAAAVERCEVDIEHDGDDADDVCVVTSSNVDPECTLAQVIGHAYGDRWCAIDHDGKYGAIVFLQDPVSVNAAGTYPRHTEPGSATLSETITLWGKLPSDGSSQYGEGSGDPLVIVGFLLQYTTDCMGHSCSNPEQGDWEYHLLVGTNAIPANRDHEAYDVNRWGTEENKTDMDPVIEMSPQDDDGNYTNAVITVDLSNSQHAAFEAKADSYVQFRYVTLKLTGGAAFDLEEGSAVSFLHSRIEVDANNEIDYMFKDYGEIRMDAMGGTSPVILTINKGATADEPFAIFNVSSGVDREELVRNLRDVIAFESRQINPGISLVAGRTPTSPIACRIFELAADDASTGGSYRCRIIGGSVDGVVRLGEYNGDGSGDEAEIYTIKTPEDVSGGTITVTRNETVFTASGQRIRVEMPTCPGGSEAPAELTCPIVNGDFNGFTENGGWDITCHDGYRRTQILKGMGVLGNSSDANIGQGICVLDCAEHMHPNEGATECVIDSGFEWNLDESAIHRECPGQPVPNVNGTGCVCEDPDEEPVEIGSRVDCKKRCVGDHMLRDGGSCACEEGFKKKQGRCIVDEDPPEYDPPRATRSTGGGTSGGETEPPPADTTCIGIACFGSSQPTDPAGSGTDAQPKGVVSGGCSLAPAAGAAAGNACLVLLLCVMAMLGVARPSLGGRRSQRK